MKISFAETYYKLSLINSSFKKLVSKNITSINLIDLYRESFKTREPNNFFIISNQSGGIQC